MTYTSKQLITARIDAHDIAESMAIAYWVEEGSKAYHISEAIKSFTKLAEVLGYDIVKRETVEESDPHSIRLV